MPKRRPTTPRRSRRRAAAVIVPATLVGTGALGLAVRKMINHKKKETKGLKLLKRVQKAHPEVKDIVKKVEDYHRQLDSFLGDAKASFAHNVSEIIKTKIRREIDLRKKDGEKLKREKEGVYKREIAGRRRRMTGTVQDEKLQLDKEEKDDAKTFRESLRRSVALPVGTVGGSLLMGYGAFLGIDGYLKPGRIPYDGEDSWLVKEVDKHFKGFPEMKQKYNSNSKIQRELQGELQKLKDVIP